MASGDEVVIVSNCYIMLHVPHVAQMSGDSEALRKTATTPDDIAASMANVYAEKSGQPVEEVGGMMDVETWLDADSALRLALADQIEEAEKMAACASLSKYRNAPSRALAAISWAPVIERIKRKRYRRVLEGDLGDVGKRIMSPTLRDLATHAIAD